MQFSSLMDRVINAVETAGEEIMTIYNSGDMGVEIKSDDSPLTLADKASHEILMESLKTLDMGPVLSEEGANIPWEQRKTWQQYWLIDPIDGTKEFIKKNGEFTVNVALIRDGQPVFGVVYAPALQLLYYGDIENGSWIRRGNEAPSKITAQKPPKKDDLWRVVGSRSHQSDDFKQFVSKFHDADIVSMGSSLKLCLVADGQADIYPRLGLTSEWDTAAAQAVVESAGGVVLNWEDKEPLRYNTKESLLNPYFIVCSEPSSVWLSN